MQPCCICSLSSLSTRCIGSGGSSSSVGWQQTVCNVETYESHGEALVLSNWDLRCIGCPRGTEIFEIFNLPSLSDGYYEFGIGGSQICGHGKIRSKCRRCGGGSLCGHAKYRSDCSICGSYIGQGSLCKQGIRKARCQECLDLIVFVIQCINRKKAGTPRINIYFILLRNYI